MIDIFILNNSIDWESLKAKARTSKGAIIFKKSPIFWMSTGIERRFDEWCRRLPADNGLLLVKLDVITARALSRQIADEVGVRHESPQILWLNADLTVRWHASHYDIHEADLSAQL